MAEEKGVHFDFEVAPLPQADHPNFALIRVEDRRGQTVTVDAKSVGGGTFRITAIDGIEVLLDGKSFETLLTVADGTGAELIASVHKQFPGVVVGSSNPRSSPVILQLSSPLPLDAEKCTGRIAAENIRQVEPVYYTQKNTAPFCSAAEMIRFSEDNGCSLGESVLEYEKTILGMSEKEAIDEMVRRYGVMKSSVAQGLNRERGRDAASRCHGGHNHG